MSDPTGAREALEMCINLLPACKCQESDNGGFVQLCESCYVSDKAHAALREINEAQAGVQTGAPATLAPDRDMVAYGKCFDDWYDCYVAWCKRTHNSPFDGPAAREGWNAGIRFCAAQGAGGMPQAPIWAYGIIDKDGEAHMSEVAVCRDRSVMESEAESMNDSEPQNAPYRVVPLFAGEPVEAIKEGGGT